MAAAPQLSGCNRRPGVDISYRLRGQLWTGVDQIEASTVFRVHYAAPYDGPLSGLMTGSGNRTWAEATVFDLGRRGLLVGILGRVWGVGGRGHDREYCFTPSVQALAIGRSHLGKLDDSLGDSQRVSVEMARAVVIPETLDVSRWPIFVHFASGAHLETARHVAVPGSPVHAEPSIASVRLGDLLSPEARVLGFSLELTDAPPSDAIVSELPFLSSIQGSRVQPSISSRGGDPLHKQLHIGHFKVSGS